MPKWAGTVEGWGAIIQDDSLEWEEKRDKLSSLLRESEWFKDAGGEDSDLDMAIMDLEDSPTIEDADNAIWSIYNLANSEMIWLDPTEGGG